MEKGNVYLVTKNNHTRLLEYGFVPGTPILLELIFNGVYVFTVRGMRIGVRKQDLESIEVIKIEGAI